MYKLTLHNSIIRLSDSASIPIDLNNADYQEYLIWLNEDNTPLPADVPTQAQIDKELEMNEAQPIAKTWFSGQTAAINFIRLTPAEQATAIDGYTLTQLKVVVKYLAIAVAMIIKRELL